jgi:hypothetical protein
VYGEQGSDNLGQLEDLDVVGNDIDVDNGVNTYKGTDEENNASRSPYLVHNNYSLISLYCMLAPPPPSSVLSLLKCNKYICILSTAVTTLQ